MNSKPSGWTARLMPRPFHWAGLQSRVTLPGQSNSCSRPPRATSPGRYFKSTAGRTWDDHSMTFNLPIIPPRQVTGLTGQGASRGGGIEIPIYYPATGQQISTLIEDGSAAVAQAVAIARDAFDKGPWPHLSVEKRMEVLEACRTKILENVDEL